MTEDEVAVVMANEFWGLLAKFDGAQKSDVCSALTIAGLNALRTLDGDEFVLGFLESAIKDLKACPPLPILPRGH